MVSVISDPGFISFMLQNRGNVILIEDAEQILSIDRNSATNNLLGISDGFLRDALQIKIVCTFNCDIGKIDPALLRKGRLYFEYHFGALSENDAQRLVDYLELGYTVTKEMTLADIFNREDNTLKDSFEERKIGFLA